MRPAGRSRRSPLPPLRRATFAATAGVLVTGAGATIAAARREPVSGPAPVVVNGSFVSPLGERFGDVRVGRGVFVASNSTLRADPGRRVMIGDHTNVQDNVSVLALNRQPGARVVGTGSRTSLAHQAEIVNSRIGAFTFVGFRARVVNATLDEGAFIGHGAVVQGVTIAKNRFVGVGQVVTTQAQADALPHKTDGDADFQRDVLDVNAEFAVGYAELYREHGYGSVTGIGPAPRTSFNPGRRPTIGAGVRINPSARIVGDVRLGASGTVGRRTSIRADEGTPIIVGAGARIGDHVTFHSLKGTRVSVGGELRAGDNAVLHGPLTVGDRLDIGPNAVLFRATVGDDVTIGEGAVIAGPASAPLRVRDGQSVPAGAVLTSQAQVDALG